MRGLSASLRAALFMLRARLPWPRPSGGRARGRIAAGPRVAAVALLAAPPSACPVGPLSPPMPAWRPGLPALPPVVEAALLMVFGAVCVAVQNGLIRVASAEIHTFEVVFFRNLFGLLAMLPLLGGVGLGMFRAHSPGRLLLMSAWHVLGMFCYFLAIVYLPLAEVTALAFSKPLFVTVGAALVLHEVVRARRWSAVALGFLGVLIVLQPGAQTISPYAALVLLGALLGAATSLMIKRLTATEGVATIVWYQALFATMLALPLCLLYWRTPDAAGWLLAARDRRARHAQLADHDAGVFPGRRLGRGAVRVPAPAVRRPGRVSVVRRGAERLDLARRRRDLRRDRLHRRARGARGPHAGLGSEERSRCDHHAMNSQGRGGSIR